MNIIQIFDNVITDEKFIGKLCKICETHVQQELGFSWVFNNSLLGKINCSLHPQENQHIIENYINNYIGKLILPYTSKYLGCEWWCNMNNDLDWHIDKDEYAMVNKNELNMPLLSSVFYPYSECYGGELLILDSSENPVNLLEKNIDPSYDPYYVNKIIRIPPKKNRLVLFTSGLLHKINRFEGDRYSVAINFWDMIPSSSDSGAYK